MKIRVPTSRLPRAILTDSLIPLEFSSDEDVPDPREIVLFTINMLCKYEKIALASHQNHGTESWTAHRQPTFFRRSNVVGLTAPAQVASVLDSPHMRKPEASHYGTRHEHVGTTNHATGRWCFVNTAFTGVTDTFASLFILRHKPRREFIQ